MKCGGRGGGAIGGAAVYIRHWPPPQIHTCHCPHQYNLKAVGHTFQKINDIPWSTVQRHRQSLNLKVPPTTPGIGAGDAYAFSKRVWTINFFWCCHFSFAFHRVILLIVFMARTMPHMTPPGRTIHWRQPDDLMIGWNSWKLVVLKYVFQRSFSALAALFISAF